MLVSLQPEVSRNTELGFCYNNTTGFDANVTLFRTNCYDMISNGTPVPNCYSQSSPNLPGCLDYGSGFTQDSFAQSINIGRAETSGVEVASRWQAGTGWGVSGNYTYIDSEQLSGDDKGAPIGLQARHIGNVSLNWAARDRLDFWLRGEYYGKRNRFANLYTNLSPANQAIVNGLGPLRAYAQFHLGGAYRASENVTINATLHNLADKNFLDGHAYTDDTGERVWGSYYTQIGAGTGGTLQEGRRLWVSVNVDF